MCHVNLVKEWSKGIWLSFATPKYDFHSWLSVLNRLSIRDLMKQWSDRANISCVLNNWNSKPHFFLLHFFNADMGQPGQESGKSQA